MSSLDSDQDKPWIERVRGTSSGPTSFDTDSSVVMSGILTCKPLEYVDQCGAVPSNIRTEVSVD